MKRLPLILTAILPCLAPHQAHAQMPPQPQQTISKVGSDSFHLNWYGIQDRTYFVQWSTDLIEWKYMPVIESGEEDIIGYGFEGDGLDRMFVRLHYTDDPTINPHSDDFDGDGISNWDEVREGGTGTDPFKQDTDGDGKSDYFADRDNNSLADGWEIEHYGSIGTADPNGNDDEDTLTNHEESLMGSNPNNKDTDGDNINDDAESVWWDSSVSVWPRSKGTRYAVVELDGLAVNAAASYVSSMFGETESSIHVMPEKNEWSIRALSNGGHVLVVEDKRKQWSANSTLNPSTIPGSVKNHVWDPATGSWTVLKNDKLGTSAQESLAVATGLSADGKVSGFAWVPLADSNGNPADGPGVEKLIVKWDNLGTNTAPTTVTALNGNAHATFSADNDILEDPAPVNLGMADNAGILYTEPGANGVTLKFAGVTLDTTVNGGHAYHPLVTGQGDVLFIDPVTAEYKMRLAGGNTGPVADGTQKPVHLKTAARIEHNGGANDTDIAALGAAIWARTGNAWKKVKPHPLRPFPGAKGVSDDLTILLGDGKTVMRNGKHIPVSKLVPGTDWTDFRMEKMNDHGMMVGRAKKAGQDKVVLLLPVEIVVPKLNAQGAEIAGEAVNAKDLKIAKMRGGVLIDPGPNALSGEYRISEDEDRFYLRIPGLPENSQVSIMLQTGHAQKPEYRDPKTEIELGYDQTKKLFTTKSMVLVSDDLDDGHSQNLAGEDNDMFVDEFKGDRSHKVALGGLVRIASVKLNGKEHVFNLDLPVKPRKQVTVKIWRVKKKNQNLPYVAVAVVNEHIKVMKERFAQLGLEVNVVGPAVKEIPSSINLDDGYQIQDAGQPGTVAEEDAFLAAVATENDADIEVFYVPNITDISDPNIDSAAGYSYVPDTFGAGRKKIHNNIVMSGDAKRYVLAHELGHILLNSGTHTYPAYHLMELTVNEIHADDFINSKRLRKVEENTIYQHPQVKNIP